MSRLWHDEAQIRCRFQLICPQQWTKLEPTMETDVRYCLECRRDVHLARTEGELRRLAQQGHCVAVPLALVDPQDSAEGMTHAVGMMGEDYLPWRDVERPQDDATDGRGQGEKDESGTEGFRCT